MIQKYELLLFFSILLFFNSNVFSQNIDAEKELEIIEEISKKDLEKAIVYSDSLLQYRFPKKITIKIKNGYICIRAGKYKKAQVVFKKIIDAYKTNKVDEFIGDAYIGYGQACGLLGFKNEALKYTFKSLKVGEELNNVELIAQSKTLFAFIYYSSKDYKNAIKYSKEAVIIQEEAKNLNALSSLYNNIAVFFDKLNNLDSSQYYNEKALETIKILGQEHRVAISYNNIGSNYKKRGQFKKAKEYFKKAILVHNKVASNNSSAHINLANLLLKSKKRNEAAKYYKQAIVIAEKTNDNKTLEEVYSKLLKIALYQKNFSHAISYQKNRDSLNLLNLKIENDDKLQMLKTQYEQVKNEATLKQKITLNHKNNIILLTLGALVLFLSLFLLQHFRNKQLKLTQEKILLEQKVLRSQMNPHFIFNALTSIQKSLLDEDLLKSSSSLSRFAKLIRQNFEFTNKNLIGLDEDLDALENYIKTQQLRFEDQFDYQINILDNLDLSYIKIPPMLLQPFVENAIEHGLKAKKEKGNLIITVSKKGVFTHFEIVDDGKGYTKKDQSKNKREHAIDIFVKRLKLRKLNEEKTFKIVPNTKNGGTKVTFNLKL